MHSIRRKTKPKVTKFFRPSFHRFIVISMGAIFLLNACIPAATEGSLQETPTVEQPAKEVSVTPLPTREAFDPGELVDYTVQDGDTVVALAARFNTTVQEIQENNTVLPQTTSTLPPGLPLKIPIYYMPFWGSPYQILPDYLFVNGPAQIAFDTLDFVEKSDGWLKSYRIYAYGDWRTGAELVQYVGLTYSISPQLLLALLEYKIQALTNPIIPNNVDRYALGFRKIYNANLYLQLLILADTLNAGYYGWRSGELHSIELQDGKLMRFDPWLNAASVSLQNYFSMVNPVDEFQKAISSAGFASTYHSLFGDFPVQTSEFIPGSLNQPEMMLPFTPNRSWAYTGGPHPAWGENQPWAAIDFAPPADKGGCAESPEWVTAVADGVLSRVELGLTILDLDGDGDERTGWAVLYLHLSRYDAAVQGKHVKAGDVLGHPSCERGQATGTHVHIARKYNGEWILADSPLPFNLEGWIVHSAGTPYLGSLTRYTQTINACTCADQASQLETGK
jgi:LasA protease